MMAVCHLILTPVVVAIRTVVRTVREVVRTVCEWVSTIIRTVREVTERVCNWLPWPLSAICNLVTRLIEVIETSWNWLCREVIDRIIRWVEVVLEYTFYIFNWICWVIDWVFRLPELLLCFLGLQPPKSVRVCVKILTDRAGNPAITPAQATAMLNDAADILRQCNLRLQVDGIELIEKEEFLDSTRCEFTGMFSDFFVWFSERANPGCVTVYFVNTIVGASGCAYPGTNWVIITANAQGCTVVQEIGHLADLWSHSDDPGNIMTNPCGPTVTRAQCCLIRTSRYASIGAMRTIADEI